MCYLYVFLKNIACKSCEGSILSLGKCRFQWRSGLDKKWGRFWEKGFVFIRKNKSSFDRFRGCWHWKGVDMGRGLES